MNEHTFSFVNSSNDQYILSLSQDGDKFLSDHVADELRKQGVEVWGILLLRKGRKETVTSIGHETYIHIIARDSHLSLVNLLKQDIKEGFEK